LLKYPRRSFSGRSYVTHARARSGTGRFIRHFALSRNPRLSCEKSPEHRPHPSRQSSAISVRTFANGTTLNCRWVPQPRLPSLNCNPLRGLLLEMVGYPDARGNAGD
jgi:hypothetical protein